MVAIIVEDAPHLFDQNLSDNTEFRWSESLVRKYIVNNLGWSWRATTKATQKLPDDVDKILEEAYLCEVYVVGNYTRSREVRSETNFTDERTLLQLHPVRVGIEPSLSARSGTCILTRRGSRDIGGHLSDFLAMLLSKQIDANSDNETD
ncbi:hypothetical protein K435DRAFT_932892 [Dendrothele bispora CBS 962.96]|uniref:Uncharacterized protein n=1 Tax=Dendrothele bispora (strain CBS 962.96) TaxID=1314807 RepID=A0A4S8L3W1_DENBC|nr:hypothetical protein K435DRAFT_932892 [Dendrothele bispora CBS 962.96]